MSLQSHCCSTFQNDFKCFHLMSRVCSPAACRGLRGRRFMVVLCYFMSPRQESFFCWQAAWRQHATSLSVCQLCSVYVVHQSLWFWQLDAYLGFVRYKINVYLQLAKRTQFGCTRVNFWLAERAKAKHLFLQRWHTYTVRPKLEVLKNYPHRARDVQVKCVCVRFCVFHPLSASPPGFQSWRW